MQSAETNTTTGPTCNHIGATSESAVEFNLLRAGYRVLIPSVISRYDIGVDTDGRLIRVQVKTGRRDRSGNLRVTWDGTYRPTEVDVIAAHDHETESTYFVPLTAVPAGSAGFTLRLPASVRGRSMLRRDKRSLDADQYVSFHNAITEVSA